MSFMKTIPIVEKFVWKSQAIAGFGFQQVRNKWANHLMIRDVKRRRMNAENFLVRTRVNALRKNDVLPIEIREMADKEISKFDYNTAPLRINNRCVITSRKLDQSFFEICKEGCNTMSPEIHSDQTYVTEEDLFKTTFNKSDFVNGENRVIDGFLQENNVFLLNIGSYDAVEDLQSCMYEVHIPSTKDRNETVDY